MEYFDSGKQHYAMLTRLDIQAIQTDAKAELENKFINMSREVEYLVFELKDLRSRVIEEHR